MKRLDLVVIFSTLIFQMTAYSQSIVQVIPLPRTTYWDQSYGLAADSTHLWISSGTSTSVYNRGFIYTTNTSGVRTDSIPTTVFPSQGLAWDGTHFWYVRGSGSSLRIYKVTTAGTVVDSILPPTSWYFGGACWDGTGLWVSLYYPNNLSALYKYDVVTKTIVDTIPSLGQQPQGIAWDGQYLYYAMDDNDGNPEKIYQVNVATKDTVRSWPLPENNMSPRGLAWDGNNLWLIAEPVGASSGRSLYKYDLAGSGTPDIQFSLDSLKLGNRRTGSAYTDSISIQNVGTAPLRIDSAGQFPLSIWWWEFASTPPIVIQPNASAKFFASFDATYGTWPVTIPIYSNDPDEPVKYLYASGTGIFGSPNISVPSNYDFISRRVGSSTSWLLTIKNLGAERLSISSIAVPGNVFKVDSLGLPVHLDSLNSVTVRVWFQPASASTYLDTLTITSNASNGSTTKIVLRGTGDPASVALGQPFWTFTVPNNPRTTSNAKLVKAVRTISDITGDGKPDVVVSCENYLTMALNGNASGTSDSLWAFNTYISNSSAGSIGSTGDYSHQKALSVADLNADGFKDVIIGTGGGNEHVYALNGRSGQILWQFGTDAPDSFGLGDISAVDVSTDFNNDGIPDVIAAGSATDVGGVGGRRSVYLFNGSNGTILWTAPLLGFTHSVAALSDVNSDGVPDVIGCVGQPSYKATAYSGANGNPLWSFPIPGSSSGAKEALAWPVQGQSPDVIVSGFWGPIFRLDGTTGAEKWNLPTGGRSAMQLVRLKDVTGDGVDEIIAPLLVGGVYCINGATGTIVWSLPTGNTMGAAAIPDLNNDGYDDVALAVQDQGTMIVRGQNGVQLVLYPTGTAQSREVAVVPDIDGNNSFEVLMGGKQGNIALLSSGDLLTSVGEELRELPQGFELGQNYPNPFNPSTTMNISLPVESDFGFTIYDVLGKEVKSYVFEHVPAGKHQIVWDGKNQIGAQVASGVYLYTMRSGSTVMSKRMILLR